MNFDKAMHRTGIMLIHNITHISHVCEASHKIRYMQDATIKCIKENSQYFL